MGPLGGMRVVEMSGIGPAPFCGMLLADMGASVLSVQRTARADLGIDVDRRFDLLNRGKQAVAADLKSPGGVDLVLSLAAKADILIEGFRPGVMERLGLGPEACMAANPRLVFGRMTGWGQDGPLKDRAGHDINYIAMAGVLGSLGPQGGAPAVPLNLIGDFGGGALFLALGLLAAVIEARKSGKGQVVDAAMVDGAATLMTMQYGLRQAGLWSLDRGANLLDGGAPFYRTYPTRDGKYVAVGAIEKRFFQALVSGLGLDPETLPGQNDTSRWSELAAAIGAEFLKRDRDDWAEHFAATDACVSPVLDMDESVSHPLAVSRGMFDDTGGVVQPRPAPQFSKTPSSVQGPPPDARETACQALADWGIDGDRIARLVAEGVIAGPADSTR